MSKLSKFLKDLFESLNNSKIEYCVVGKTFSKFDVDTNSDIDIITTENDLKKFINVIINLTQDQDIFLLNFISYGFKSFYIIISDRRNKENLLHKIDVCSEYRINKRSFALLSSEILLNNKIKKEVDSSFVYFAEYANNFLYYILKKSSKKSLSESDFEFFKYIYFLDPEKVIKKLSFCISNENIILITRYLIKNNFELFLNLISENKLFNLKISNKKKFIFIKDEIKRFAFRIKNPTGKIIAILGPDGSGKSTIIKELSKSLKDLGRKQRILHFWPNRVLNNKKKYAQVLNPHSKKSYKYVISFLKLSYIIIRYNINWLTSIYFRYISSTIFLFDRYFIDLYADPKRYRVNLGLNWIKIAYKFIIKPDIIIILDVAPKILKSRKKEVSMQESLQQYTKYKEIKKLHENIFIINGNKNTFEVLSDCEDVICQTFSEKMIKVFFDFYRNDV